MLAQPRSRPRYRMLLDIAPSDSAKLATSQRVRCCGNTGVVYNKRHSEMRLHVFELCVTPMSTLVHALERIKSQHLPSHQEVEALTQETPQVPRPHLQRHPDLCPLTVLQKALVGACQHDPIHQKMTADDSSPVWTSESYSGRAVALWLPASSDFAGGVDLTDVETGRTSRVCQNPG
ncbi:uncharacterized protein EI90DRAFT_2560528 [Cantharellus anzutake]|uniref:uncharacterized protein n=1 Tax=Cantharellus anzutake TaxID=1750568 RepID=UPI001904A2E6|nr:uncharacterized protein EI90DRAFT_2560528 [Cantharellus anzutake]KAF8338200.1 hypothetical protein EI90DRAFT_2560528 [Cantharellus anzutake]